MGAVMDAVIATERLTKRFGGRDGVVAVDEVSLRVRKGEVYGFVGLNGAGKTTAIRMLLGMIRPSAGGAYLLGERVDAGRRDLWAKVGYMVETPHSYPELTVAQNLEIVRRLRGIDDEHAMARTMDDLGLTRYRDRRAGLLSLGNKQRLGLAKALLHEPAILILDEPTNGLDPAGIVEVRQLLRRLATDKGVTIFLSSHLLGEVAKLVSRLGIIHDGRLVEETDGKRLEKSLHRRLVVRSRDNRAAQAALRRAGHTVVTGGDTLIVTDERAVQQPDDVATKLVRAGAPPVLLRVKTEDLESYFLRTIGGDGTPDRGERSDGEEAKGQ